MTRKGDSRGKTVRVKTARGRTNSSNRWLQRQLNDPYVQKARDEGYRSRAAFKIKELDDKYHFLKKNSEVVDLGAAPGGWSQVAVERVGEGHVVGLDLLEIPYLSGAEFLQMDFMEDEAPATLKGMKGRVDVVLSDMAPNASGQPDLDHMRIVILVEAAFYFALDVLKPGGVFVAKVWQGGTERQLLELMKKHFTKVHHAKPKSSRQDSAETFVVAIGFKVKSLKIRRFKRYFILILIFVNSPLLSFLMTIAPAGARTCLNYQKRLCKRFAHGIQSPAQDPTNEIAATKSLL